MSNRVLFIYILYIYFMCACCETVLISIAGLFEIVTCTNNVSVYHLLGFGNWSNACNIARRSMYVPDKCQICRRNMDMNIIKL